MKSGRRLPIEGPDIYRLTIDGKVFRVRHENGSPRFLGQASRRCPKLYVVLQRNRPIYVGITRQPARARIRQGLQASGKHGYHGYGWRNATTPLRFDIWFHRGQNPKHAYLDLETIEAELVFLIRSRGQWPKYQTEIHFHASSATHRRAAEHLSSFYEAGA